jgi:hypothetical protein
MNRVEIYPNKIELSFLDHFNHETFNHDPGPAISWLNDQGLDWKLMSVFQRWAVLNDPAFMRKINGEEPIPPFELPWSTKGEFLSRVQEFLEVYPDLKPLIASSTKVGVSA